MTLATIFRGDERILLGLFEDSAGALLAFEAKRLPGDRLHLARVLPGPTGVTYALLTDSWNL